MTTTDPWSTEDASIYDLAVPRSYDRSKFYTKGVDSNGERATVRVNMPRALKSAIGRIVATQQIPDYQGIADPFRNYFVHGLKYDADLIGDPEYVKPINEFVVEADVAYIAEKARAIRETVDNILRTIHATQSPSLRAQLSAQIRILIDMTDDLGIKQQLNGFLFTLP